MYVYRAEDEGKEKEDEQIKRQQIATKFIVKIEETNVNI